MADSQSNALTAPAQTASDVLRRAHDEHAFRAESFAAALIALASQDHDISPLALSAMAMDLEKHVQGLAGAIDEAHEILNGRGGEA
jgi:hypothetical protein